MSMERMEQVTCPHCGKQGTMQVWQSVNTAIDPETRELVRSGELFAYKCPSCGAVTNVNYGFLYHQMEDQLMIYYVTDEESCASVAEMFSGQDERMGRLMDKSGVDGYLMRIVLSQNALREKLFIFDRGLDDRIVEILKYLYISLLRKSIRSLPWTQGISRSHPPGSGRWICSARRGIWPAWSSVRSSTAAWRRICGISCRNFAGACLWWTRRGPRISFWSTCDYKKRNSPAAEGRPRSGCFVIIWRPAPRPGSGCGVRPQR